jgi:hypothetical protein
MQGIEELPTWLADAWGINETTAQLILSITVILMLLLPVMVLSRGKNAPTIWLITVFFGECIVLGLGWLPFWIMIMTICVTVLSIAWLGGNLTGE